MEQNEISQSLDETELAVLGAAITQTGGFWKVSAELIESDFRKEWPRNLFNAIQSEIEENNEVERLALARRLEQSYETKEALVIVDSAIEKASPADLLEGHIAIVRKAGIDRLVADKGRSLAKNPGAAEAIVGEILEAKSRLFMTKKDSAISAVMARCIEDIQRLHDQDDDQLAGLSSGFADIDKKTNGLMGGDFIVVAGRPSMGKSVFGQNMAETSAITNGLPTLIISCEMTDKQYGFRMLASQGRIPLQAVRSGKFEEEQWNKLSSALGKIHESDMYIEDTSRFQTVAAIRHRAEEIKRKHGKIGLIVVDYLQLLCPSKPHGSKNDEVTEISRDLKKLAKDLDVPVVALSQLNRNVEGRTDKRPMMSDIRESGAIEQDADIIILLYRDEYYNPDSPEKGVAEAIVGKIRNGETGTVRLAFLGEYQRFENFARDYRPDYGSSEYQPKSKAKLAVVGNGGENEVFR